MVGSTAGKPGVGMVPGFACTSGATGVLIGLPAYLGIPVWFVLLGRYLGAPVG
jgi:hypothetical protein